MGTAAARCAEKVVQRIACILTIELIAAAQAMAIRRQQLPAHSLEKGTDRALRWVRRWVDPMESDRSVVFDHENPRQAIFWEHRSEI